MNEVAIWARKERRARPLRRPIFRERDLTTVKEGLSDSNHVLCAAHAHIRISHYTLDPTVSGLLHSAHEVGVAELAVGAGGQCEDFRDLRGGQVGARHRTHERRQL